MGWYHISKESFWKKPDMLVCSAADPRGFTEETLPPVGFFCPLLVKKSEIGNTPAGK